MPVSATVLAASALLLSSAAWAQPGGPPPPPPGRSQPYGQPAYGPPPGPPPRHIGFGGGAGIGFMDNRYHDLACVDCDSDPIAGDVQVYGGFFLTRPLMLMGEIDATLQSLDAQGTNYLVQTSVILGAKLWINPAFWIKGGLGWSNLSVRYDDAYATYDDDLANGGALMLGVGYDFVQAPSFTIDGNFKLIAAGYDELDDSIYSGTFNLGFNFYL